MSATGDRLDPEGRSRLKPELDVLALLEKLVATDSQNPGAQEAEVARYVDALARELGFSSRIIDTAPGRSNVLVTIDAGGPRALALCGHLDTKPTGAGEHQWETPPLEMVVHDGLAYGLGTSDMKGAVAAMLVAAERWSKSANSGRLELVFTADEEAGSQYGASMLSERDLVRADAMLIGEPSGIDVPWESLFLVSRGICRFEVDVESTQGHSGLSERLPTSATIAAARAVLALDEELELSYDPHPDYRYQPTVNPGVLIEGGVNYGVHPGNATVCCDVRLVPGMSQTLLDREVRKVLEETMPDDVRWSVRYGRNALAWKEPVDIKPDHELVIAAQESCEATFGRRLPYAAYPGGTDATPFVSVANIPTVPSLGPGWLSVAHAPNERVGVDQLSQAVDLYEEIAHRFLRSSRV